MNRYFSSRRRWADGLITLLHEESCMVAAAKKTAVTSEVAGSRHVRMPSGWLLVVTCRKRASKLGNRKIRE
jgi:hypothetical protein